MHMLDRQASIQCMQIIRHFFSRRHTVQVSFVFFSWIITLIMSLRASIDLINLLSLRTFEYLQNEDSYTYPNDSNAVLRRIVGYSVNTNIK